MFPFKVFNIALVLVYSIGSAIWVSTGDTWYRSLNQPSWQPPDWVFGLIWPYNFIVLGILGWIVASRVDQSSNRVWSTFLAIGVVSALFWSRIFYINHQILLSTLFLLFVAISAVILFIYSLTKVGGISFIILPYVLWVSTATALSYSYSRLN